MSSEPPSTAGVLSTVYAKSSPPELLVSHLSATLEGGRSLARRVGRIAAIDGVFGDNFWPAVWLACLTHDAGKVAEGFQAMVRGRTRRWGERHEVLSLGFLPGLVHDPAMLAWVATGVATHHRPFTGTSGRDLETLYGPSDLAELRDRFEPIDEHVVAAVGQWLYDTASAAELPVTSSDAHELTVTDVLCDAHRLADELFTRWHGPADAARGLAAVLLQGAVTLSDHLSSANGRLSTEQPLNATFRARWENRLDARGLTPREHQLLAAEVTTHLLLRAPTGSGKTEAALLWAARQVVDLAQATGGTPRVFYTLPYLSSINAMAERLGVLFGNTELVGVSHSRAASYHLATAICPDDTPPDDDTKAEHAAKAVSRAAATRLFRETVRVGTPYQLMRAALAGPAHSGILVDTANSVFVLDELHTYDARRLGYLLASATLWERLGCRIAVLSATQPTMLVELIQSSLQHPVAIVDTPHLGVPRHRLCTRSYGLTETAALEEIRLRLARDDSVLVVANNVAHAVDLFEQLAPQVRQRHGHDAAILLHSRYRRIDRSTIEQAIISRFRSGVGERRPGLLVATQVVEVSLDIDFDVLFTAGAPLEALLQRFGRVNRLDSRPPADVIVHAPAWTKRGKQGDEYADGVYPRAVVESAWRILLDNDGRIVDENDVTTWLNRSYADEWGQRWREDVERHREAFSRAFLQFRYPFDDREQLAEVFDELFDGTEAVLVEDTDDYEAALALGKGAAGRLLADEYLIPMPHWAAPLSRYERRLKVRVIDGDYDSRIGLRAVRGPADKVYQPGIVL